MTDHLSAEKRSWNMAQIKGKDTKPEVLVRSMLHRAGYRFRKNVKTLPGKPDIVLPKYRTVIFVHGCFWHRHKGCKQATTPKTNKAFWKKKFERNVSNDRKHTRELRKLGWKVVIVWACQLKKPEKVFQRLEKCLTAKQPKDGQHKFIHRKRAHRKHVLPSPKGHGRTGKKARELSFPLSAFHEFA